MKRRFFLLATPAIVAAPSLMRVSTAAQWPVSVEAFVPFPELERVPSISELITTTLRNNTAKYAALIQQNNAILRKLRDMSDVQAVQYAGYDRLTSGLTS